MARVTSGSGSNIFMSLVGVCLVWWFDNCRQTKIER